MGIALKAQVMFKEYYVSEKMNRNIRGSRKQLKDEESFFWFFAFVFAIFCVFKAA